MLFRLEAEADKNVYGIYNMSPKQFTGFGNDSADDRPRYAKYHKKTAFPSRLKSTLNKLDSKSLHFGYESDAVDSEYSDGPEISQRRDALTWDDAESGTEADDQCLKPVTVALGWISILI